MASGIPNYGQNAKYNADERDDDRDSVRNEEVLSLVLVSVDRSHRVDSCFCPV